MKIRGFISCLLTILLAVALAACTGPRPEAIDVKSDEGGALLTAADPIMANLIEAVGAADYNAFTQDFGPEMQKAMTEERFQEMVSTLNAKVGRCASWDLNRLEKVGDYYAVIYNLHCAEEETVAWRVVLTQAEPHRVSGLWYDSPKLRQK